MAEKLYRDPLTGPEAFFPVRGWSQLYNGIPYTDSTAATVYGSEFWDDTPAPAVASPAVRPSRRIMHRRRGR